MLASGLVMPTIETARRAARLRALGILRVVLALAALPAAAQAPADPAATLGLRDRIVAVVDEDPILASDIDRIAGLGLTVPEPGEGEREFRRRVLEGLIEQRLRFHEVDRFGVSPVPVEAIQQQVAAIRLRFESEEAFERRLVELELDLTALQQLVARQLMVLNYVEERLGPQVFVSLEDIERYHREVLTPALTQRGEAVPPIEEVREDIRELLREQRLNARLVTWTRELRNEADIAIFFDEPAELPPVVHTFARPQEP